tara:strand:+ start:251 stop:466 length:216 start_codon:yes stop_codon:yes gene_type:complete
MDSRKQPMARKGIFLRLSPEIKQQLSVIQQRVEDVHDQLGLPKTEVDVHDVLVDLVNRGFKSYQSDKNKLH